MNASGSPYSAVFNILHMAIKMPENISCAGCGFLGIYHLGVAAALRENAPHLLHGHFSGASAGSLASASVLCDIPVEVTTSSMLHIAVSVRKRLTGPFSPSFPVHTLLQDVLHKIFPPDAHLRVSGKIQISVTRVYDKKNVLLTHFDTFDDLVIGLLCSSFIPGFSGWLPYTVGKVHYIDGGFSNNLPILDEHTITVSPFAGEASICPKDGEASDYTLSIFGTSLSLNMDTLHRLSRVMLPPSTKELQRICQQGYTDACDFVINKKIHAPNCPIPSYENCKLELPESMSAIFEEVMAREEVTQEPAKMNEKNMIKLQLANFTCYKILNTLRDNQDRMLDRK